MVKGHIFPRMFHGMAVYFGGSQNPSSVSIGLTKSIMSFYSTQIAKSNLFERIYQLFANRCDLVSSS